MNLLLNYIAEQLSSHFNEPVNIINESQLFGGDINQAFQLQTNIGKLFLKLNNVSLKDMFEKEFDGLQLLYKTNTVKIPEPLIHGYFEDAIFLVTGFIEAGRPSINFWKQFATSLAVLHKNSNEEFGLSYNNYIGSLPQQNNFCNTWSEFYVTQRIMPLATLAFNQNKLTKEQVMLAEKLCLRFKEFFPEEKPSLIHGDLWNGNYMCSKDGAAFIYDPAVYYGNREMDIAMTLLFGGFNKSFYDYYDEAFPLIPGWKKRIQLCQLYPLMAHLILFGGSYQNSVINILKQYA